MLLVLFVLVVPLACGNDEGDSSVPGGKPSDEVPVPELVCPDYAANTFPEMAPFVVEKATHASPLNGTFSVSSTGSLRCSIPLELPPGRRLAPQLEIVVDNANVSIGGLSSIHRCGTNLAQDGELRGVQFSPDDNYCLNNSRLIQIGMGSDSIGAFAEYRTAVDAHTKIVGYGAPAANGFDVTYFVTYSPSGTISHFGKGQNSRVSWRGVTRSWNLERKLDRRGNTIRYKYANLTNGAKDATTLESVIDKIWYTSFVDADGVEMLGEQLIDFEYDDDDRYGKLFYEGEEVSRRMRLDKIVAKSKGIAVRSYRFDYVEDALTNKALVSEIKECAQDDVAQCTQPIRFQWDQAEGAGFSAQASGTNVPSKSDDDQFSWTVADVDSNGAPDLVSSTKHPDSGLNQWFVHANNGQGNFSTPVEWLSASFPTGFTKPWQITPLDENGDGRIDLLIDQPGRPGWNHLRVLRSVADPSPHFEWVTTNVPRVDGHRADEFTLESHSGYVLADIDADGMSDVIRCQDTRTWDGHDDYVANDCNADATCKESLGSGDIVDPSGMHSERLPMHEFGDCYSTL